MRIWPSAATGCSTRQPGPSCGATTSNSWVRTAQPPAIPDGRVLAVGYLVLAPGLDLASHADAWIAVDALDGSSMVLDHVSILEDGVERARAKLEYTTLATSFCAERFTMSELRSVYEAVWATGLDPRNFNRKVLATDGFTEATDQRTTRGGGRPALLYTAGPATALHPPLTRG